MRTLSDLSWWKQNPHLIYRKSVNKKQITRRQSGCFFNTVQKKKWNSFLSGHNVILPITMGSPEIPAVIFFLPLRVLQSWNTNWRDAQSTCAHGKEQLNVWPDIHQEQPLSDTEHGTVVCVRSEKFQKLLIFWEFPTKTSLGFPENVWERENIQRETVFFLNCVHLWCINWMTIKEIRMLLVVDARGQRRIGQPRTGTWGFTQAH